MSLTIMVRRLSKIWVTFITHNILTMSNSLLQVIKVVLIVTYGSNLI